MPNSAMLRSWSGLLFGAAASLLAACPATSAPQKVTVAQPLARSVTIYVSATGTTGAANQVDLIARVVGTLVSVGYKDGDRVSKGQTLFGIDPAAYQASVQSAQAAVEKAQAQLAQSNADLARKTQLGQQQVASQADLDTSKANRDAAQADVDQAKAQLVSAQITLGYTSIAAPFGGVVSARLADPGALVGTGGATTLATIYETDPIRVSFSLDERLVETIRATLRQRNLTVNDLGPLEVFVGLQTETGYPHRGQISYIAPSLDTGTGTLGLRADVPNADGALLPGQFVRVHIPVERNVKVLVVPDAAVLTDQGGRYVLTVDGKGTVAAVPVETGDETGAGGIQIRSGLDAGARVIVAGASDATPGAVVAATETTLDPGLAPQ